MPTNRFYSPFDIETLDPRRPGAGEYRSSFQIDRDRIIHSSSFRRLQSKTQVFLSGEYDFYRTRLTHSIEVAQIGRSICAWLLQSSDLLADDFFIDPDLVESACLAHDLGHPPFGHTGERSLHRLMSPFGGFEGNAQTLRILTQTIFSEGREGMNPTRALLDAVLKYKTLRSEDGGAKNHYLYDDQARHLRFAVGDLDFPASLTPGAGRNGFRSIECQIMDWADDTAYSLNDIADGIHAGFISVPKLEAWASTQTMDDAEQRHFEFLCRAIREERVESRLNRSIGGCIRGCSLAPAENFLSASTPRHQLRLDIEPDLQVQTRLHKRIALELVFLSPALQQLDHKADFILTRMFGVLRERYIEKGAGSRLRLMPAALESEVEKSDDASVRARLVCDWISNMTDRFAFRTYRRLFDADFGSITDFV